jgi:hypothetical protein
VACPGAGLAAEIAKGDGRPRVYVVEPTGDYENDPNVTDEKFPGNPTRSYRSRQPLRIVGELERWEPYDEAFIRELRIRIANGRGEIINQAPILQDVVAVLHAPHAWGGATVASPSVIPANARIQVRRLGEAIARPVAVSRLDPRLRGNDDERCFPLARE